MSMNISNHSRKVQSEIDAIIERELALPLTLPPPIPSNWTFTDSNVSNINITDIPPFTDASSVSTANTQQPSTFVVTDLDETGTTFSSNKSVSRSSAKPTWESSHSFSAECHICGLTIHQYDEYCAHLKAEHYDKDPELEWLTCDVCGKSNAHKSNFISHLASHTGRKPFKCRIRLSSGEFCCTEASTRQNLQTHIQKVHKLNVKHELLQPHKPRVPKPDSKKKKSTKSKTHKKSSKTKKRKNKEFDFMDINDDVYSYTYKPRKAKRRRTQRKLTIDAQKNSPFYHPMEILVAAAAFVELNHKAFQNNTQINEELVKEAGRNWESLLDPKTIENLTNIANHIEDIATTKQIF